MSHIAGVMEEHAARFGLEDSQELANFALDYVQHTGQQLKTLLVNEDSEAAAKYAHKAIGSVRLYGTPQLEVLLGCVRDNDYKPEMAHDLQHELCAEFTLIEQALRKWLAQSDNS